MNSLINDTISNLVKNLNINHNHDNRYYTETEINNKISDINTTINEKAASNRTHDNRYYTESEIGSKISKVYSSITDKASKTHTHNDLYYTKKKILKDKFLLKPYDCTYHNYYLQNQSIINGANVSQTFKTDNGGCYIVHIGQLSFTYIPSIYIEKASTYNSNCNSAAVGISIDCTTEYCEYILSSFNNFGDLYLRKTFILKICTCQDLEVQNGKTQNQLFYYGIILKTEH